MPKDLQILKNLGTEANYYTRRAPHFKAFSFLSWRMALPVKLREKIEPCSCHGGFCTQQLQKCGKNGFATSGIRVWLMPHT